MTGGPHPPPAGAPAGAPTATGPPAVALVTFGCRVNQADSLALDRALATAGCASVPLAAADVVIVNTCAVTAAAEQAARQAIRRIALAHPRARIVVTGCYAARAAPELAALPRVSAVIADRAAIPAASRGLAPPPAGAGRAAAGSASPAPGRLGRTVYTLAVQWGCDERCSYCVVPATRGPGRSLPPARVLEEMRRLADAGFHEVMLTGVHLGSYGRDLPEPATLGCLLRALAGVPGAPLIRVGSIEPMDVTPEVEDLLAGAGRFAPHVHLPLQHASDRLLGAMRRPYTLKAYAALAARLARRMPGAAVGADVIVGFPGETAADVEALASYLDDSPLTYLHVFPYSPRPATPAAALPGRIPGSAVRDRVERIREIGRALAERFRRAQVGQVRPALTIRDGSIAVTDNYLHVRVGAGHARNARVLVELLADGMPMEGRVVRSALKASRPAAAPATDGDPPR